MNVYCIEEFINEFNAIRSKRNYSDLENEIISYFIGKSINDVKSGTRLNNSDTSPYIKKRLGGSGGYRVYYLLIIKDDNLYLMFVHPKTGPKGSPNISDDYKPIIYKNTLAAIKSNSLYSVTCNVENTKLIFTKTPIILVKKAL